MKSVSSIFNDIFFSLTKFSTQNKNQFQVPLAVSIAGIKHIDYKSHPVSVKILNGGIGYHTATIEITSQRGHGINSTFIFYAR